MKYRKKPVIIDAVQWTGDNIQAIHDFILERSKPGYSHGTDPQGLFIMTLEGIHRADVGDFIIRGVKGEYYPCKPDIFEMTYEKVEKYDK